jgi:hypothetical protein
MLFVLAVGEEWAAALIPQTQVPKLDLTEELVAVEVYTGFKVYYLLCLSPVPLLLVRVVF